MFLLRRTGGMVLTVLVASLVIFFALQAAPGDPVTAIIGDPEKVTPDRIAQVRAQYGLDQPMLVQYLHWLQAVVTGDWGISYHYVQPVGELVASRLPVTLSLVAFASVLFVVLGIGLGAWSALRRGRAADFAITTVTTFLGAVPSFVIGLVLVYVLGVWLGWFPVAGTGRGAWGRFSHLALPALSLAAGALAIVTRVTRQSMAEQLDADHVEAARGHGMTGSMLVMRHVVRNAWGPIITMIAIVMASLLSGTVVIESVFGLNGLGTLLVNGANDHDRPVVQAVLLFMVVAYMLMTTLVDVVQGLLDPRLRARRTS